MVQSKSSFDIAGMLHLNKKSILQTHNRPPQFGNRFFLAISRVPGATVCQIPIDYKVMYRIDLRQAMRHDMAACAGMPGATSTATCRQIDCIAQARTQTKTSRARRRNLAWVLANRAGTMVSSGVMVMPGLGIAGVHEFPIGNISRPGCICLRD
jgi:hypothetical protein